MKKYASKTKVTLNAALVLQWRARKEFTQAEAAKRAGVSLPTYQSAEYGKPLQLVKASKIAKAVRVPLSELEARSA